jgi:hypothetical protein
MKTTKKNHELLARLAKVGAGIRINQLEVELAQIRRAFPCEAPEPEDAGRRQRLLEHMARMRAARQAKATLNSRRPRRKTGTRG